MIWSRTITTLRSLGLSPVRARPWQANKKAHSHLHFTDNCGHTHKTVFTYILWQYFRQIQPAPLLSFPHPSSVLPFT